MRDSLVYLNGQLIPSADARLEIYDRAIVQGATVSEMTRTFGQKLFRLEDHLRRLWNSLSAVGLEIGLTLDELAGVSYELVTHNAAIAGEATELGLIHFVSAGEHGMYAGPPVRPGPTVCAHTFPLRLETWAKKFREGVHVVTPEVRQIPPECVDPQIKCRSRMHYYLADRAAQKRHPGSRALLVDRQGYVIETTTANVVLFREDAGLLLPPDDKILPGISLAVLLELAEEWDMSYTHRDLKAADVAAADEVYLTSTSPCMMPVVRMNGEPIGSGHPGAMFGRFISAWNDLVGLDIIAQARRFANR